ncbi:hypothetical protein [Consotaella aegiceratis]|uniref:hypothetical protein n=1 Tax=Consotaella aegiceratis TaxID=3097961 RepID=UPI002F425740
MRRLGTAVEITQRRHFGRFRANRSQRLFPRKPIPCRFLPKRFVLTLRLVVKGCGMAGLSSSNAELWMRSARAFDQEADRLWELANGYAGWGFCEETSSARRDALDLRVRALMVRAQAAALDAPDSV